VKVKNLMQTSTKFCKVFALKFLPLFKMVPRYLLLVPVLLSFSVPPNLHCVLSVCEGKKVEKPLLQIQIHKRKGLLKPAA